MSIHRFFNRSQVTTARPTVLLIRILVGWVFVSEGIGKFIFASTHGSGRFEKIGIPFAPLMGPCVGTVEILCGALLLFGFLTRLAVIPLLCDMAVAIISTKLPILLGYGIGPFTLPSVSQFGLWSMLHEARTDLSMLFGLVFLLIEGAGAWSLDARISQR